MDQPPWDQRAARILVKPLALTPVTPNQLTTLTLVLALASAGLFAAGDPTLAGWAAGLFVLARFLDHFDGELARLKGVASRFGYYYDYVAGAVSYAALFLGIGIGLAAGPLGPWALLLGLAGSASALLSMGLNLGIDKAKAQETGIGGENDAIGYPGYAGFELEDGIYLLAPITWLGFLTPFFVAAGIGAVVYCLWSLWLLARTRRRVSGCR
ncbi:MAG: CDP-alcohol phosphatidyltransferase family protein [Rhodospirillales bacterium]|jgi:phosphatidylglycerophosphate synthase|nr:CDP-alcohol phosphatidyltransferase family protein [Rhodospirillales bacterium]MDP6883694.1 CDP-alcohol phosphatidyltransferase family protein [Rhodospirillales bacterium]